MLNLSKLIGGNSDKLISWGIAENTEPYDRRHYFDLNVRKWIGLLFALAAIFDDFPQGIIRLILNM